MLTAYMQAPKLCPDARQHRRQRPLYKQALAIIKSAPGPTHPDTQRGQRNLAALDAAQG